MTLDQFLTALLAAFLSSLGAFYGTSLAFKKFRRERLWEARYHAYRQVLEDVHQVGAVAELRRATLTQEHAPRPTNPKDDEARDRLEREAAVGGMLLDDAFVQRLIKFNTDVYLLDFEAAGSLLLANTDTEKGYIRIKKAGELVALATDAQKDLQKLVKTAI